MNKFLPTLALVASAGLALTGCSTHPAAAAKPTHTTAPAPVVAPVDTPTPEPSFAYEDAFPTLTLKVLSKQCFGDAGCSMRVKPVLAVLDPSLVPDDATGSITYEIDGGEDGPVTDTLTLTGSQYEASEEAISTSSSGAKLKIKITDTETDPQ